MELPQLRMEKCDLDRVPEVRVPEGYTLRTFRSGDQTGLAEVYAACELGCRTREDVQERLVMRPYFQPGRVFVMEYEGAIVGTATAWEEPSEPPCGYLHMVGVLPEHRGKRLGCALTVAAIRRHREEGFAVQRLDTDDVRLAAIRLYLRLGYRPLLTHPSHEVRWRAVLKRLSWDPVFTHGSRKTPQEGANEQR